MKLSWTLIDGPDGVFAHAQRGLLLIDLSTVYPVTSQQLSRLGSERGVGVLDVTISGSTPAAENGLLTLFGGGDKECFDAAESIFRGIARKYFYLGPSGSGTTMKLVVNTLLGVGMQAIAEAVALGEKAGLDRIRLLGVLSQTAVVAPAHLGKLQRAMKSDYSPQFPIRLMNKDFGLILELANAVGARMPAAGAAFEINARQSDEASGARFFGGNSANGETCASWFQRQQARLIGGRFGRGSIVVVEGDSLWVHAGQENDST